MPTESLKAILDRDFSKVAAKQLIDIASPLLQETVNYSTTLFGRCQSSILPDKHEDNAIPYLYLHMIEMTDAIEVLILNSCTNPSIPLLRSSFESLVSIDYITKDNSTQRALAWAADYAHDKLSSIELYDKSSKKGKSFSEIFDTEINLVEKNMPDQDYVSKKISGIKELLSEPQFEDIEKERNRLISRYKGWPKWYQLFGGPRNLSKLCEILGRKSQYDVLYSYWSSITHAHDISRHFKTFGNKLGFVGLRDSSDMALVIKLSSIFLIEGSIKVAKYYRPDDEILIARWYLTNVRDLLNKV